MAKEPAKTPDPAKAADAAKAADGQVKVTEANATQTVVDRVETNTDADGETASAEIRQETLDPPVLGARTVTAAERREPVVNANPGTLPATARVMPNGTTTKLSRTSDDKTERTFTATVRILRSKTLYEPGATIPLTRVEFEAKRARKAIEEESWLDGERVDDAAA